jgi:hypothetical protein
MSLAAIRAKLLAQDSRTQQNQSQGTGDNAIYPFWNMPDGQSASLRFLPDADTSNSYFWVERAMIKLPFNGIKGQNESKQVTVQVPCMEMYGDNCSILSEVRTWYKDESLKETANKYWKKRTYLFQGFVRQNPLADDKEPENIIRRYVISPQIFTIIKSSLMDPELEEMPTDYLNGLDFKIVKGKKGDYADYATSSWSRKASALTEVEHAAIASHGLFNLREFLPKKPTESETRVIREMFDASVDGRPYDPDKWGAYYKPYGLQVAGSTAKDEADDEGQRSRVSAPTINRTPTPTPVPVASKPVAPWEDEAPVAEAKAPASNDKANDILAMIRSRQAKPA